MDRSRVGFNPEELMSAGYTVKELKAVGFEWFALHLWCKKELEELGKDNAITGLHQLGYTSSREIRLMFEEHAAEMRMSGYSGKGYTLQEVLDAGVSLSQIRLSGYKVSEMREMGFGAVELRDAGYPAHRFTSETGFTVEDLLAAGFIESELLDAGFHQNEVDAVLRPKAKKGGPKKGKSKKKLA